MMMIYMPVNAATYALYSHRTWRSPFLRGKLRSEWRLPGRGIRGWSAMPLMAISQSGGWMLLAGAYGYLTSGAAAALQGFWLAAFGVIHAATQSDRKLGSEGAVALGVAVLGGGLAAASASGSVGMRGVGGLAMSLVGGTLLAISVDRNLEWGKILAQRLSLPGGLAVELQMAGNTICRAAFTAVFAAVFASGVRLGDVPLNLPASLLIAFGAASDVTASYLFRRGNAAASWMGVNAPVAAAPFFSLLWVFALGGFAPVRPDWLLLGAAALGAAVMTERGRRGRLPVAVWAVCAGGYVLGFGEIAAATSLALLAWPKTREVFPPRLVAASAVAAAVAALAALISP